MATAAAPGPWAVVRESDKGGRRGISVKDAAGGFITNLVMQLAENEMANARLIAAAPELLAALKLVMAMLEDGRLVRDISKDGRPDYSMAMLALVRDLQTIQSAIFKAEGR